MTTCDILLVGVGGQGVLTIGDLLLRAAFAADLPASFCPTKGMAQRGGFVKAELRLGAAGVGPRIGMHSADIAVSMERSEALKAIPFIQPTGTFVLYDHVWEPTGVQLGVDEYPELDDVSEEITAAGARLRIVHPDDLPISGGKPVAPNVVLLGVLLSLPSLSDLLDATAMESVIATRWSKAAGPNLQAFRWGLAAHGSSGGTRDGDA